MRGRSSCEPPDAAPPRAEGGRVALRLRLVEGGQSGPLDGAWWPRSRDLRTEATDLVDHFPEGVGRIEGLLFSRPDWDAASRPPGLRWIRAARGAVEVRSFASDDTHVMILSLSSGQRLRLLVVPSDTDPGHASRVMRRAADEGNAASPSTLLGLSGPDQSHIGSAVWDDHAGGHA